jgi:transcriptional regulator with XRE-family HTH domain
VSAAATLIRQVRVRSGLTQRELATRLGKAQATIARLEREGANPTLATLDEAMHATGHRLELRAVPVRAEVNEEQILDHLRLTPAERAHAHDAAYDGLRESLRGARRIDG